jgi:predicted O-linked N-acetylglucosamine transferase (SPINDLY family)
LRALLQVLAGGGVWRDVGRLPEAALAQQIRQDEIDILVELTGALVRADTVN